MRDQEKIEILDTTLREGEQCYGVFFPLETKKQIALLLNEIGVDFIEVGHPAAAPSIKKAVSEIVKLELTSRLIAHARLDKDEIRRVKDLGLKWVGLFCGINDRSRSRYHLSEQAIYGKIADAVSYAKELGLSIRFGCEDASRTEIGELIKFYSHLALLGVDRMSYSDTLGILRPQDVETLFARINDHIPFNTLHFHFHNDSGFASENAIKAIECGARCIDTTISGIGERMGLVSLENVIAYLDRKSRLKTLANKYQTATVAEATNLVERCINLNHFQARRFAHKSGIHINGMLKDPDNYESTDSCSADSKRIFVLSKLIGKSGLQMILSNHEFADDEKNTLMMLEQVKADDLLELGDPKEIIQYFTQRGLKRHA